MLPRSIEAVATEFTETAQKMKAFLTVAFIFALTGGLQAVITETCIDCFNTIENGNATQCSEVNGVTVCGEYNLSEEFFNERSDPAIANAGWSFENCAKDETCARWCIKLYMRLHENQCASDLGGTNSSLVCHHYGRIFNGGSWGCKSTDTCSYVDSVRNMCYNYNTGTKSHNSTISGSGHPNECGP